MKKIIIILITLIYSCNSKQICDFNKLNKSRWIYVDGYNVVDVLELGSRQMIGNDCSIIIDNKKVAYIKSVSKNKLIISSDSIKGEIGIYTKF